MKKIIFYSIIMILIIPIAISVTNLDIWDNQVFYVVPFNETYDNESGKVCMEEDHIYFQQTPFQDAPTLNFTGDSDSSHNHFYYNHIQNMSNFTVMFWYWHEGGGTDNQYFATQYNASNKNGDWRITIWPSTGKLSADWFCGGGTDEAAYTNNELFTNTRNMIAVRFIQNGSLWVELFVNDSLKDSGNRACSTIVTPHSNLTIGGRISWHEVTDLKGSISQFVITNKSLSNAEIEHFYDYTKDGSVWDDGTIAVPPAPQSTYLSERFRVRGGSYYKMRGESRLKVR